jgi:hypothetical protein
MHLSVLRVLHFLPISLSLISLFSNILWRVKIMNLQTKQFSPGSYCFPYIPK